MSDRAVGDVEDITRYVGGSHFDAATGQVNASAFDRSPKDVDGLSVNRVGVFSREIRDDRFELRRVMASRMKIGKTAVFVQFNVGDALSALAEFEEEIFVAADPLVADGVGLANPAHAVIVGLPFKGEAIGSLKAELAGDRLRAVIKDTFPAVQTASGSSTP
ncbi:hypothetical protein [Novosphingobium sp. Leaf2]|uniref:hypothetical protein n=1 Tax=Novosphingobium sp. Leaf2 TaxID=1735670 RepID=UPI0012E1296C|nr:hypothetical protein [Novosphingobium sp. Leaf2]